MQQKQVLPAGRQGFTLIEIIMTMGIFGIIMVVGSNFLIQTIRNANQATIQNEVRQNASAIFQDIKTEARKAYCIYYNYDTGTMIALLRLSDDPNGTSCNSGSRVEYSNDLNSGQNGKVTKKTIDVTGVVTSTLVLTSQTAAILDCSAGSLACNSINCVPGLSLFQSGVSNNGMPVTATISAQQITSQTQSDFCARVKLSDTITPRVK